ncbi:MAG: GIY-YIG nuclease family protein [Mycoplasmoidaceae bacterium]
MNKHAIYTIIFDALEGFRIDELDGLRSFYIPKDQLHKIGKNDFHKKYGLSNAGIYFLIHKNEKKVYVGQTGDLYNRLQQHKRSNKFAKGGFAIAIATESNTLSKTFIDYLEYHYIQKYKNSEFWNLENEEKREKIPNIQIFETIKIEKLISKINIILRLNRVMFDRKKPLTKENESNIIANNSENIFYYKGAKVLFNEGYMILLEGSIISNLTTEKIQKMHSSKYSWEELRSRMLTVLKYKNQFLENKLIKVINEDSCILLSNIRIKSPKLCSILISGVPEVDLNDFRNKQGISLSEFYKQ